METNEPSASRVLAEAARVFRTPVCDVLGCDVPVVLAGMGGVARAELVTAVSNAGGYGFLGMVREKPDFIRQQIHEVRAATHRDFGVNLIPAATPPALFQEELRVCIKENVHSVCLFWDVDSDAIALLRANGILVVCQVGSLPDAKQALAAGAQILIVQGIEAGGHVRGSETLALLLEKILEISSDTPVLVAGGIASGLAFFGALEYGAAGVVMGTAFLATNESFAHDYHKSRIVTAKIGDAILTNVFHINWPIGAAVRVLKNSVTEGNHGDPFRGEREKIGIEDGRSIFRFSTDSPLRVTTGDLESMALYAGQRVDLIQNISSAEERMREILLVALVLRHQKHEGKQSKRVLSQSVLSSSACYASEADDSYMGFMSRAELIAFLNELLEAERASARVASRLALDLTDTNLKLAMWKLHTNEVHCCRILLDQLSILDTTPSSRTGDFYEKLMAIKGAEDRIAFLAKGQKWVERRISEALPKIRSEKLHVGLSHILALHGPL